MSHVEGLNGQWIGKYAGATTGHIHVNIDEYELNYKGVAYLFNDNKLLPPAVASFATLNKDRDFSCRTTRIRAVELASKAVVPWEQVKGQYADDTMFSEYADIRGSFDQNALTLSWVTNIGVANSCVLPRSRAGQPSELISQKQEWSEYKEHVIKMALGPKRLLFRGQNKPWRLQTLFHRLGRADLNRFVETDVPLLHQYLSARTKHVFKLEDSDEYGAFLSLVQHHGYPTPILDWTYSPYIAAFFAYRGITNEKAARASPEDKVRILIFDSEEWNLRLEAVPLLAPPLLHVTVRDFTAIENERMIPQQAASTVTSIDDIETYIRGLETGTLKYLHAIDLPMSERKQVIRELSYMGITAASLFPGLDGACEELAERNFGF